jgi:hypothetical protein
MSKELKKAIKLASKRIPTLRDRALNHNLSFFCGSMADAFRQGVQEAQTEIVSRLRAEMGKDSEHG